MCVAEVYCVLLQSKNLFSDLAKDLKMKIICLTQYIP
jgi:hypothetical protein